MGYTKSHSNYVLKNKHKSLDSGTIFERDYTTIGGVDSFAKGETPIYRSGNFLITINTDKVPNKPHGNIKWVENSDGEIWKLSNVENIGDILEDDVKIVLKNDYYNLADFAYYGSCSELIRGSINDILKRFPSELYITDSRAQYNELNKDYEAYSNTGKFFYVQNPSNVDIITTYINESNVENELHYLSANDYWKNYEIFDSASTVESIGTTITSVTVTDADKTEFSAATSCVAYKTIINSGKIILYAAKVGKTNNYQIFSTNNIGYHIRPKKEFLSKFYKTLDSFQKILLNPKTEPLYTASFDIYYEDEEKGLRHSIQDFTFPIGNGGYNIGTNKIAFGEYLTRLLTASEFYDTKFSDNLYRMMTHESIKNFDWTYKKVNDKYEEYEEGSQKITQLLRLFGREFDEIKFYIDNITNYNCITYDDRGNMPSYFFTDTLENDGWDVINIFPYSMTKSDENKRIFSQIIDDNIYPYSGKVDNEYGYFLNCSGKTSATSISDKFSFDDNILRQRVKKYTSNKPLSYKEVNIEFLKRLKLSSKHILRQKGTIHGIEMLLGMLGLKSKNFVNCFNDSNYCTSGETFSSMNEKYDFDIKEYTSFVNGVIDPYWDCKGNNRIDWYNSTKVMHYKDDNQKYKGLPVVYRYTWFDGINYIDDEIKDIISYNEESFTLTYFNLSDEKIVKSSIYRNTIIYPNFEHDIEIDGNLYYQMDGGWLKTSPYKFDKDNNIVSGNNVYTETLNCLKIVDTVDELTQVNYSDIENGQIYYVNDMSGRYILLNGYLYKVDVDSRNNKYISVSVIDNSFEIGGLTIYGSFLSYYPYQAYEDDEEPLREYDLSYNSEDGHVKLYLKDLSGSSYVLLRQNIDYDDDTVDGYAIPLDNQKYITDGIFEDFTELSSNTKTNYFKIKNKDYKGIFGEDGWVQLSVNDLEYRKINLLKNYKKGNNQHSGNLKYDNGFAYMNYFANLFNYSYNNDLFDYRLYRGTFYNELENIKQIGFKNLIDNECGSYYTYEDSKIHYFGDWLDVLSETPSEYEYNVNDMESWYDYNEYSANTLNINPSAQTVSGICSDANIDGTTNQILNTKRVLITFYLSPHSDNDTEDLLSQNSMKEIKFYEDVVIPYLTQMIPMNTILEINYSNKRE